MGKSIIIYRNNQLEGVIGVPIEELMGLGFISKALGTMVGVILLYMWQMSNKRIIGMMFGGTSGLMLAMICFDVLPEALGKGRIALVCVGVIIGGCIGLLMDDAVPSVQKCLGDRGKHLSKAGLALSIGMILDVLPEGVTLGALGHTGVEAVQRFAAILTLHSIPEGMALAMAFKQAGTKVRVVGGIAIILGVLEAMVGAICFALSGINEGYIVTTLGIASGVIIYVVCEELMPEAKKTWNGRMTTIATIIGMLIGLLLLQGH